MSEREWLSQEMADRYTEAVNDPPSRRPRYPQPDPAPVLEAAKRNRKTWLEAMKAVNSNGHLTESDREAQQDYLNELDIDNQDLQEYSD